MTLLAVSQRVDVVPGRDERRDALDQRVALWLAAADCRAYPVPNALGGELAVHAWLDGLRPGGIVLSGGNDLGREPSRDATETALLAYARERGLPVLGVCRGMQVLAHLAGTGLKPVSGHVRATHSLAGEITGPANSFHDFALAAVPAGYRVLARSDDGEIEAMAHEGLPWEGWMWHPEREPTFLQRDLARLRALFRV